MAELTEDDGDVSWLRALLERRRPDQCPVVDRWSLGIGDMVADHPKTPKPLRGIARKLNRFGGLAVSEQAIEFDGDDVEWSDITEIRTRSLVEYMFSGALDKQAEKLPLPMFPGRGRLLDAISRAALTLLLATAKEQLNHEAFDIRIPAEVEYRGILRRRNLAPGILAAVVLADPAVNTCVQATAEANGVVMRHADDDMMDNADRRAEQIKAKLAAIEARLDRRSPHRH